MPDMCCLVLAGPGEPLSWRLNLVPRSCSIIRIRSIVAGRSLDTEMFKVAARVKPNFTALGSVNTMRHAT
jgi:hypothetical protein